MPTELMLSDNIELSEFHSQFRGALWLFELFAQSTADLLSWGCIHTARYLYFTC